MTQDLDKLSSRVQTLFQRFPIVAEEQLMKEVGCAELDELHKVLKDLKSLQIQFHSFSLDNSHTVTIYWLSTLFAPLPDPVQSTSENDEANALNQTKTDENLLAKSNHLDKPSPALLQRLKRSRRSITNISPQSIQAPVKRQKISHISSNNNESVPIEEQERRLRVQIFERKKTVEELRKNLQRKANAEKHRDEIKRLDELIEKWRSACQEALIEIKSKILNTSSSQELTIRHLLHHFQIDPKKLNYDEETDSFL